jgi:hypothetical protein
VIYRAEIEQYRSNQPAPSQPGQINGAYRIGYFAVIASDGQGWEHVSVSLRDRTPTWDEMCIIKDLFWDEHETVIQFHPKKSEYVNRHPYCLHLWKPSKGEIVLPPKWMVG